MARRGTPLPIALRQEIKERRKRGETPTQIANALKLSRVTVYKFARQVCTPPICDTPSLM